MKKNVVLDENLLEFLSDGRYDKPMVEEIVENLPWAENMEIKVKEKIVRNLVPDFFYHDRKLYKLAILAGGEEEMIGEGLVKEVILANMALGKVNKKVYEFANYRMELEELKDWRTFAQFGDCDVLLRNNAIVEMARYGNEECFDKLIEMGYEQLLFDYGGKLGILHLLENEKYDVFTKSNNWKKANKAMVGYASIPTLRLNLAKIYLLAGNTSYNWDLRHEIVNLYMQGASSPAGDVVDVALSVCLAMCSMSHGYLVQTVIKSFAKEYRKEIERRYKAAFEKERDRPDR